MSTLQWTNCSSSNDRKLITNNIWDKKKRREYTYTIPHGPSGAQDENEDEEGYPMQTLEEEEEDEEEEEEKKVQQWHLSSITVSVVKSWKRR